MSITPNESHPPVSIIIVNYNGRELLEEYLPSIIRAASCYGGAAEIMIADDCSTDDGIVFVEQTYPQIRIVSTPANSGFLANANNGINAASNDIVILLNSDVWVSEGSIEPLVRHFADDSVFSVTPRGILPRMGFANESFTRAIFRNGILDRLQMGIERYGDDYFDRPQPCAYACGGYAVYDRKKFLALGGFDPLLRPDSSEDFDIGYVASKAGWRNIYEPGSVVYHYNRSSLGERHQREVRNQILSTWKNLDDLRLWIRHAVFFVRALARAVWKGDPRSRLYAGAFRSALSRAGEAVRSRRRRKTLASARTDREILTQLAPPERTEALFNNIVYELNLLRSSRVTGLMDENPEHVNNRMDSLLAARWSDWLNIYVHELENRLAHLTALRNLMEERKHYMRALTGDSLFRIYAFGKRNMERVLAFVKG